MRHRLDPAPAHRAAALFGRLEAQTLLDPAESDRALRDAAARAVGVDRIGLRLRLFDARDGARAWWQGQRGRAAWRIRDAVARALGRRAPRAAIRSAAAQADPDATLLPHEREDIILTELRRHLRRLDRRA